MNQKDIFDKYLQNSLTAEEFSEFENRLVKDAQLRKQFVDYATEISLLVRVGLRLQSAEQLDASATKEKPGSPRFRLLPIILTPLAAAACALIAFGIWEYQLSSARSGNNSTHATITMIRHKGTTVQALAQTPSWKTGDILQPGASIHSGPEEEITLTYADASQIVIHKATELILTSTAEDAKTIHLKQGLLAASITPQPPLRPMKIITPHAEATVLGTRFWISCNGMRSRLTVTEGAVRLSQINATNTVEVVSGKSMEISSNSDRPKLQTLQDLKFLPGAVLFRDDFENGVTNWTAFTRPNNTSAWVQATSSWIKNPVSTTGTNRTHTMLLDCRNGVEAKTFYTAAPFLLRGKAFLLEYDWMAQKGEGDKWLLAPLLFDSGLHRDLPSQHKTIATDPHSLFLSPQWRRIRVEVIPFLDNQSREVFQITAFVDNQSVKQIHSIGHWEDIRFPFIYNLQGWIDNVQARELYPEP